MSQLVLQNMQKIYIIINRNICIIKNDFSPDSVFNIDLAPALTS